MQQGEAGNAAALAEKLGVTERAVYRDPAALTDLGVPHYFDEEDGRYRVRKDLFSPPVQLSPAESPTLRYLANGIGGGEQIALAVPAARAMEKIRSQLPQRGLDELGDVHEHIDVKLPASGPAGEAASSRGPKADQSAPAQLVQARQMLHLRHLSLVVIQQASIEIHRRTPSHRADAAATLSTSTGRWVAISSMATPAVISPANQAKPRPRRPAYHWPKLGRTG